ncbi:hypothetical protein LTR99_001767 [Exophiala xenobiotica]|uniref:C2H2-type domain-containing protein n=1 Tax=Vermiconidia calcicola TaxID=1690605 RepID=A0AAV9Q5R6_9PEZI|nr:hypothetical protein LTR92_007405 [Exophiala xenobiotica]KAK5536535.1 hypothetical protein LTR25_005209 [Vermiconidia calcicola]KAK5543324.1 hypothetical protein LTR23_004801 [Chaetothyriales sp. CCFEE 6169]KAK5272376.1 hypothetical protein LTR96_002006 [Exophiala xenobiotica]KAK5306077.1 hypothetical protein LTR99_001767 [Exophiala xenobiotica]
MEHLKRHLVTHQGVKPYECSICGKRYSRREHDDREIRTFCDDRESGDEDMGVADEGTRLQVSTESNERSTKEPVSQQNRHGIFSYVDATYLGSPVLVTPGSTSGPDLSRGSDPARAGAEQGGHRRAVEPISTPQILPECSSSEHVPPDEEGNGGRHKQLPSWYSDFNMLDGDAAHAFDLGLGVEGLDLTWLDSCYSPFADLDSAFEARYTGDLGIDHEQGITAETGDSDMAQEGTISTDAMPEGICLVQLDPWAAHRGSILEQLRTTGKLTADQISWLSCANMKLFLGSFFRYLHRHTPFIHCPTWNISTARTHLVLSMMLVGAMYAGDLKVNGPKVRELRDLAEQFAWRIDEVTRLSVVFPKCPDI